MKVGLIAASLVLAAGGASACSSAPSTGEFCSGYEDFTAALLSIDTDDQADYINSLKDAAEDWGDVGVPDDMSGDAKAGFELILDSIDSLDDDSALDELDQMQDDFSEEEQKNASAFEDFLTKECPAADSGEGEGEGEGE